MYVELLVAIVILNIDCAFIIMYSADHARVEILPWHKNKNEGAHKIDWQRARREQAPIFFKRVLASFPSTNLLQHHDIGR